MVGQSEREQQNVAGVAEIHFLILVVLGHCLGLCVIIL